MKKTWIILSVTVLVMSMVSTAQGHILWLTASNYSPRIGEQVTIDIGFGHKFPHTETVRENNIERIFLVDPKGQESAIEKVAPAKYTFTPKSEGQYEVIILMKPGFVSNTTSGRKLGNKKTLEGVVTCFRFSMQAKTLINVGSKGTSPARQSNLPLEIILPENVEKLKTGDELLLKVIYQGKPLAGAKVSATDENTALQKEGAWVQESESNEQGEVSLKLISRGPWLITATHEVPYTDQSECDTFTFRLTLTLSLE